MGRIDRMCTPDDPAYLKDEGMRKLIDGGFGFIPPGDPRTINPADIPPIGPCSRGDTSYRDTLRRASVASGEGDYVYPRTMVWFVVEGIEDNAAVLGATYYKLLMDSGSPLLGKTVVPGVDESGLIRTRNGAETIRNVLMNECRLRPR
jgi:hypothetical protein